ncbi:hypothetical protein ACTGJ9_025080 [Bradyrhizobium sp. RDM12]
MSAEPETIRPRLPSPRLALLPMVIFGSRWLQLPLYLGLILAQCASVLKIKLAMAIIGISSIALLRTSIEAGNLGSSRASFTESGVMWQVLIHITFVASAVGIVFVDKVSDATARRQPE